MTIPRRSWRAAGTLAAAAVVGLTGAVLTAGPAAAHTPTWDVTCTEVSLHLSAYNGNVANQVTVTVDGKDLLPTETFGKGLDKTIELPEHDKALTVRLVVKAGDGDQYSRDESKQAPVCEETQEPTPTPSETKPSETPTTATPTPTDTPSESASSSAPAAATPSPSSPDLAETGSSSATPIIGGAAVAVLLAGGGIMWSVRKRRTAQH
ncbi:LPXTG cell wall anchor domain-containing protein [Streptomyces sp. NBC_01220]|uniref:LAETG motif-containing sortase-dependent surface protein n=1 Tax=Streptomyces sp. NBC_01220 TaxID=2903781 RepID=UPI00352BF200|nr:LPXTG cell wall anchor domain-containing protein [Streptomyces sp. NBC_01220]